MGTWPQEKQKTILLIGKQMYYRRKTLITPEQNLLQR
jgi:hypothetical protein